MCFVQHLFKSFFKKLDIVSQTRSIQTHYKNDVALPARNQTALQNLRFQKKMD